MKSTIALLVLLASGLAYAGSVTVTAVGTVYGENRSYTAVENDCKGNLKNIGGGKYQCTVTISTAGANDTLIRAANVNFTVSRSCTANVTTNLTGYVLTVNPGPGALADADACFGDVFHRTNIATTTLDTLVFIIK